LKTENCLVLLHGLQAKNWPSIIGGPNFWSAFTPHVKALGLISEFQPMRSTDFDNLKQQNGLDFSCKAALNGRCEEYELLSS
jgi:hypothetical protein